MNILTIDTATKFEIVALSAHGSIFDATHKADVSHTITLFERIESVLREGSISIEQVEAIGVGIGPGSFTGVRIAVSTARMLAQVLRIPLIPIPSTLYWASSLDAREGDFIVAAFDAKKGRFFAALYKTLAEPLSFEEACPPGDYFIEQILSKYDGTSPITVIGEGIEQYEEQIRGISPRGTIIHDFIPHGKSACAIAEKMFLKNPETYHDFRSVLPQYARKSDAEIILEKKKAL